MRRLMEPESFGSTLPRQMLTALAFAGIAISLRWGLSSWLGEHHEFLPGYVAVAAATWLGTWRAGIVVTIIGLGAINFPAIQGQQPAGPALQDGASLVAFVTVSGLLIVLGHHAFKQMHALTDEVFRLDAADHKKSDFLALIAHELRNPLSSLRVASALIRNGRLDGSTLQRTWEMMERQTDHMARLVGDLLDVARIEQGKITLELKRAKIAAVIEESVAQASSYTSARAQRVEVEGDTDAAEADVDLLRIGQVLGNLLHNASKFSPKGAVITIRVGVSPHAVLIAVKDAGVGIPPSQLSAIFGAFVQLQPASGRPQGLGLGLELCKKLVELHGGSISAHSDGTGLGSEFVVELPRARNAEPQSAGLGTPPHEEESALTPSTGGPAPLRILVVDDNRDAADSLAMLLSMSGHESSTACDGTSALAQIQRDRPDFVFLDIGLPDISGHEVARRLRQQVKWKQPVLAALTGWGGEDDIRLAKQSGFDTHLTKPVSMEQIVHALTVRPSCRSPADQEEHA